VGEGSRGVNCHGRWPASHAGRGGRLVLCAALPRSRRASSRARMADGGTGRPAGNFSRPVRVAAGQPGRLVAGGAARERLPSSSTRRVSCSLDLDALARLLALCWLWRPIDQTAFNALNWRWRCCLWSSSSPPRCKFTGDATTRTLLNLASASVENFHVLT
jgi:hypothetical protein